MKDRERERDKKNFSFSVLITAKFGPEYKNDHMFHVRHVCGRWVGGVASNDFETPP